MTVRRIILVLGLLVAVVGVSQVAAPEWWLGVTRPMVDWSGLWALGIVALALGVVLVYAALRRIVGLRTFVLILGAWMVLAGALLLFAPAMMKDLVYALVLNRPSGFQLAMARGAGLLRVVLGIALIFAVAKPEPKPTKNEVPDESAG